MIIAKANAKENLGEFICLSITKANAKTNLQIVICNHFGVDGTFIGPQGGVTDQQGPKYSQKKVPSIVPPFFS